jgi:membrane associated rhomboid family serine protease
MASYRRWGGGTSGRVGGGIGSGSYHVLGFVIPKVVGWLVIATIGATALGAVLGRNGIPVVPNADLNPALVWTGQLWRLVTWGLFEYGWDGLNLIFGCAALLLVGRDLATRWTAGRLLAIYFGTMAVAGAVTCVIARLLWPTLMGADYLGMWPAINGLFIAWAVMNPEASVYISFVLPVKGRNLIYVIVGMTVIFSMIKGPAFFIPHFAAELFMLLYMDVISVRRLFLRGRMAMLQRDYKRRTAHLRMVERDEEKPPRWMH